MCPNALVHILQREREGGRESESERERERVREREEFIRIAQTRVYENIHASKDINAIRCGREEV
jgi:hypothetical protein